MLLYLELCAFLLQIPKDFYISQLHVSLNKYLNATDFSGAVRCLIPKPFAHRIIFLDICHSIFLLHVYYLG